MKSIMKLFIWKQGFNSIFFILYDSIRTIYRYCVSLLRSKQSFIHYYGLPVVQIPLLRSSNLSMRKNKAILMLIPFVASHPSMTEVT